ncbi:centrosomal protein of 97 kDa isoform X2 [Linepithema humile]|uniref:centrosomal protein of 97 kDa isoform X2 n=1 Tax=Linepithema humile TaxID=83485 RepID=UPI0006235DF3|nr:PREDICTED: centrosomal protein of 97 kDa [Linepithema humile]XP_012218039.1 PREDICTED: centrosomal protein of 97 kDa [Linepithema humile]
MASTESLVCDTLDLSGQGLKKLSRCPSDADISTLIIDDNDIQRLDNLDSYHRITKLSIVRNQLLRMYGVSKLHNLVTLNLANNGILTIEGIKDMINLQTLCLAGNNIKSIEHLHTNTKLEHLDLSENSISHISDISYLRSLKELFLHNNRIITLRQCERYLPTSLETFTLANNNITDLNEMSHLANLKNLVNFSIANNPCVSMTGNSIGFDYRPFVINWCMSLKSIDGYAVDPLESLKAEWLYSQGRGRQFRVGEHALLAQYLASVCPLSGESLENETDRKLRLILSKAQHHQQQLNQQSDAGSVHSLSSVAMSPSPAARRRLSNNRTNSPRRPTSARNSLKMKSPDRMVSSCHTDAMVSSCHVLLNDDHEQNTMMTQSLDPNMLSGTLSNKTSNNSLQDMEETSSPLQAATKLVPVPESLMSPDFRPPSGLSRILPKTPTASKLSSPCQITIPSKPSMDGDGKAIPIINTVNPMAKTNLSAIKANALVKSNSATNCSVPKPNIAKPVVTYANSKCPHSVKINNYVQSKTLPAKRSMKSPNLARSIQRPKSANERLKSNLNKDKDGGNATQSSDEDSEVCQAKLDGIRHRALQRRQEDSNKDQDQVEKAAICIQRMWRGYYTRNLNGKATNILKTIDMLRTNKYIQKLSTDMEATRTALESEHKLQLLQMQAINALWKKVVSLQPGSNRENAFSDADNALQPNADVVSNLAQTCNLLHTQVQELQDSMSEIKRCMSSMKPRPTLVDNGVGTQTEISAVHTPAGEENTFPYVRANRPQSLPIHQTIHEGNENKSFASNLVDSVLKKVSQSTDTTDDEVNTDILNSNENPEVLNSNENPEMFKSCEEIIESDLKEAVENEATNDYEEIIENAIDGEVCEETLCKELHNLIETENGAKHYENPEKENAVNGDDKEIC